MSEHLAKAGLVYLGIVVLTILLIGMIVGNESYWLFCIVAVIVVILKALFVYEIASFVRCRFQKVKNNNRDFMD